MQIDIALDTYDDIFSDFDIRTYKDRQFSRDFLDELKIRMVKNKDGSPISITLLVPSDSRSLKQEKLISKRLSLFFNERYSSYCGKRKSNSRQSAVLGLLGLVLLFVANVLSKYIGNTFRDFLLIPSWYFVWSACEKFFGSRKEIKKKLKYYGILSCSSVAFKDRE